MRLSLACLGLTLMALASWTQPLDISLIHTDLEDLPAPAREAYLEAVDALDHLDQITAVYALAEAAEAAPESVELQRQFVNVARATVRPDNFGLEPALRIANRCVDAYERILAVEDIPDWALQMAVREREELLELLTNVDTLIRERREAGQAFMQERARLEERIAQAQREFSRELSRRRALGQTSNPQAPGNDVRRVSTTGETADSDAVQANPLLRPGNIR